MALTKARIILALVLINDVSGFSAATRRQWLKDYISGITSIVIAHQNANAINPNVEIDTSKTSNPFVRYDTVSMLPEEYFTEHRSLFGFTERVLDGDTIRVRHVPGYGIYATAQAPEPLKKRGIANDTLIVRLYAIDCPEIAKTKNQVTQPFGEDAKLFTSNLLYHKMVKITFLRRDRYGRAIAVVETVPNALLVDNNGLDISMELAKRGLAEMYTGGGAQYNVSIIKKAIGAGSH